MNFNFALVVTIGVCRLLVTGELIANAAGVGVAMVGTAALMAGVGDKLCIGVGVVVIAFASMYTLLRDFYTYIENIFNYR